MLSDVSEVIRSQCLMEEYGPASNNSQQSCWLQSAITSSVIRARRTQSPQRTYFYFIKKYTCLDNLYPVLKKIRCFLICFQMRYVHSLFVTSTSTKRTGIQHYYTKNLINGHVSGCEASEGLCPCGCPLTENGWVLWVSHLDLRVTPFSGQKRTMVI